MSYVQGFLLAVPEARKAEYIALAEAVWEVARDHGCLALRENWGVDVPDGTVTSFPMAVKLAAGETVVFAWMEWPDRETCEAAHRSMMEDPRMQAMHGRKPPFDGMRMMWGGFAPVVDRRA
ncbi:MAG: DUF1428 domain-containing protein [Rhodobacteraceae bacterium]|nr:DUF1428 domain-containing protein [Paracoccaceae bacterium]